MDDIAKLHRSKTVQATLEDGKITSLEWPTKSPDVKPIENIWDLFFRAIYKSSQTTDEERNNLADYSSKSLIMYCSDKLTVM